MQIAPLGLDYGTKKLIFDPIDKNELIESIARYVGTVDFRRETDSLISKGIKRAINENPNDPKASGWTFLINKGNRKKYEIIESIRPLAEFRGMKNPDQPLEFDNKCMQCDWHEWIRDNYDTLNATPVGKPRYIMIVGGPHDVPYHFQSELDIGANVGRVDFDSIEDLQKYIQKVIRIEQSNNAVTNGGTTFFATNGGETDPTYYSHHFLVNPLKDHVRDVMNRNVTELVEDNATKKKLLDNLKNSKSSLIFTASHGMGAPGADADTQKRVTGAICCQEEPGRSDEGDWLLTAEDIPNTDEPFLEGSVIFQFACLGYGTPKMSDLNHWFPQNWGFPQQIAHDDFTSALPKKLLAHKRGPIAYIGHLDNALLHGFDDPDNPGTDIQSPRIVPFLSCVEKILSSHSVSEAMNDMNEKYSSQAVKIMRLNDDHQKKDIEDSVYFTQLSDAFLTGIDARNFMLMGDPACFVKYK